MSTQDIFAEVQAATPTAWEAAFAEARDALAATFPAGYAPECAGQLAWDMLPESLRDDALEDLFYTYAEFMEFAEATKARAGLDRTRLAEIATQVDVYAAASGWRARWRRNRAAHRIAALAAGLAGGVW